MNLYGFVGNDGVNKWDILGLATTMDAVSGEIESTTTLSSCCLNEFGWEVEKVEDDFGKKCCPDVIKRKGIQYFYQNTSFKVFPVIGGLATYGLEHSGHVGIKTPNVFKGFYPTNVTKRRWVSDGRVRNESDVDPTRVWDGSKDYDACPESIEIVEELLAEYENYFNDPARVGPTINQPNPWGGANGAAFNLEGGNTGKNCASFASTIIEKAGGIPPCSANETFNQSTGINF